MFSDEEEGEEEVQERSFDDHLVADIIRGGEALLFLPNGVGFVQSETDQNLSSDQEFTSPHESVVEDDQNYATELLSMHDTDLSDSESEYNDGNHDGDETVLQEIPARRDSDSVHNNRVSNNKGWPTSPIITIDLRNHDLVMDGEKIINDGTIYSYIMYSLYISNKIVTIYSYSHMLYFCICI